MRLVGELSGTAQPRTCFIEYPSLVDALTSIASLAENAPCDFTVHGIYPFEQTVEVYFTLGLSAVSWKPKGIREEAAFIAASKGLHAGS